MLPFWATMSKQRSTLSQGRNFHAKLVRHCCRFWQQSRTLLRHLCPKRQQCRSNVGHCRSNIRHCSIRQCCFDIVAGVGGALGRPKSPVHTSDNVAETGDNVAETGDIVALVPSTQATLSPKPATIRQHCCQNTMLPVSATLSPVSATMSRFLATMSPFWRHCRWCGRGLRCVAQRE